jgi:hypothetical protein
MVGMEDMDGSGVEDSDDVADIVPLLSPVVMIKDEGGEDCET